MRYFCLHALNEIRKEFFLIWSYRIQWAFEILALILFFFFLSRMNPTHSGELSLINYAIWFYAILIIGDMGGKLANEMRTGTFEQLCLGVIPMAWILTARIFASIIRATVLFLLLIIPLAVLFSIPVPFQHMLLFFEVFCGLIPGLLGLSFLLGGITLLIKDAGPIVNIVNNSILFLSGGFIPLSAFPGWATAFATHLPTTQAIAILKNKLGGSIRGNSIYGDMTILLGYSLLYLIVGILSFLYCERRVRIAGTSGHY
jgi:ABC-2 type transport system permease protein